MFSLAEIVIDGATDAYDRRYSYLIPDYIGEKALPGCRVTIPFGKGNIKKQGMILSVLMTDEISGKEKYISGLIDGTPILSPEMIALCEWMHDRVFCTYFDAIKIMLPAAFNYSFHKYYSVNPEFSSLLLLNENETAIFSYLNSIGKTDLIKISKEFENAEEILEELEKKQALILETQPVRRMNDFTRRYVRFNDECDLDAQKLTQRQREIAELVMVSGSLCIKEIQYFTGASDAVIKALQKKNILIPYEKEEIRNQNPPEKVTDKHEIVLSDEQKTAYSGLHSQMLSGKAATSLLYGITGSGKTQVFLKLVDDALEAKKGVIIMVPEIALTPQMIHIFTSRYGNQIAVFHSAMSLGKRMDEYKRIKTGKALVAIGTRSAVFAPFDDIGLIVIDEEQEHTYKSEKSPRFHARDIAKFRANYHNALLCLASATPSLESYSAALSGKCGLYKLSHRYGEAVLPSVSVVDMKSEILSGNSSAISRELAEAIETELDNKKQVILLLNRRGHNTFISCPSCGWVASCPNCSISLTYHSDNHRMMCHYCGYSVPLDKKCPQCSSEHLKFMGYGTQKVEEELKLIFKDARILRLDADSTIARDSYATYLSAFANGEYDIMLGTQMVAKGLDFPKVSLVGVIGADMALYSDDYRGFERTFSLLTQVVGRAGRAGNAGRAIIQTIEPESNVIELAKTQNYDAFYNSEILTRKVMTFPPFCDICVICSQSEDRKAAYDAINEIFTTIKEKISGEYNDIKLIILGPAPTAIPKVNNRYRFKMIIKCKNSKRMRTLIRESASVKKNKDVSVLIDINPETII